jgi:hypothetical protein
VEMEFKTSLDKLAKVVTIVITIIFASIIIGQLVLIPDSVQSASFFTILVLVLGYIIVFLHRPVSYIVADGLLVIHRPFRDIKLNLKDLKNVELLDKERLNGSIRTFGVGGLFGYWGRFANSKIGVMTWYATRRDNAVLITTINNKKIVLTPDEPELFASTIVL